MLPEACAAAVADGALSCVVVEASSEASLAAVGHTRIDHTALLAALVGRVTVSNPFLAEDTRSAPEAVGELFVLGPERAVFASLTGARMRLVLLVAPPTMSVAIGWSLLRRVAAAADASE